MQETFQQQVRTVMLLKVAHRISLLGKWTWMAETANSAVTVYEDVVMGLADCLA
jgi:hypothetical protein